MSEAISEDVGGTAEVAPQEAAAGAVAGAGAEAAEAPLSSVDVPPLAVAESARELVQEPIQQPIQEPTAEPIPDPAIAIALAIAPDPVAATAKRRRKFPWRWVGAVVTMLAVGTGCAFAVMAPERTNLPGLKTAADGRYDFAPIVLPTLAPGQSDPNSSGNAGKQHISDIRKLLLAPPTSAVPDRSLPGTSGWISRAATLQVLGGDQAAEQLQADGWRHTAGIAWKTPDGAETKIWLVQFIDSDAVGDAAPAFSSFGDGSQGLPTTVALADDTAANYVRVAKGATATWYGQVQVDDTEFLIEYTAPASIGIGPFEQEMDLQVEMLQ